MQISRKIVSLSLLALLSVLAACSADSDAPARETFIAQWKQAHAAGDADALMGLYCWDGVEDSHRSFVRQSVIYDCELPLASVEIIPLQDASDFDYTHEGQRFGPNLEPVATLEVVFANDERLHVQHPLGRQEGQYLMVNPRPLSGD